MTSAMSKLVYMPNFRVIGQSVWEKNTNRHTHTHTQTHTYTYTQHTHTHTETETDTLDRYAS